MSLVPLNQDVLLYKAQVRDKWGVYIPSDPITVKCRYRYQLTEMDTSKDKEVVPRGSAIFEGTQIMTHNDMIGFTAINGHAYKLRFDSIKPINDENGKTILTKVTF